MIDIAKRIAFDAHRGQYRRDGVTPYIAHPQAVAELLAGESDEVVAVAWLHDVLEDTQVTEAFLRSQGISDRVIKAVDILTKKKGVKYFDYIELVKSDEIARKVKVADMVSNLTDKPTERQIAKYLKGLLILSNA